MIWCNYQLPAGLELCGMYNAPIADDPSIPTVCLALTDGKTTKRLWEANPAVGAEEPSRAEIYQKYSHQVRKVMSRLSLLTEAELRSLLQ